MEERRQHKRNSVSWLVRLWLRHNWFTVARATDASQHGLGIALANRIPPGVLQPGQSYRVEVRTEHDGQLVLVGELRSITDQSIGLEIKEPVFPLHRGQRRSEKSAE